MSDRERKMNEMERRMLAEVYRRMVREIARARASGNDEMARFLTEELIDVEMRLNEGAVGLSALIGK